MHKQMAIQLQLRSWLIIHGAMQDKKNQTTRIERLTLQM